MNAPRSNAGDSNTQEIIEALARENSVSVDRVRELYESEHDRLAAQASVTTYVSVIASRLVRRTLHAERAARS